MDIENRDTADNGTSFLLEKRSAFHQIKTYYQSFILTFILAFATWIILSGRFDLFHLALGAFSCAAVSFFSADLLFPDPSMKRLPGQWCRFLRYMPWLLYQIFLANIHIMFLVFHPRMMSLIDPRIIRFKSRLNDKMSLFIFANSITLTPGTITVNVSIYGDFTVHAIDKHSGTSLPGQMEENVEKIMNY